MMNLSSVFFCALLLISASARADFKSALLHKNQVSERSKGTKNGIFKQKINHEDPADLRTFDQRFYYNSEFASNSKAPVLYYICGEVECSGDELTSGFIKTLAKTLKANVVAIEHRYYGDSQPFSLLTPENLKYLSTAQALADLDAFQKYSQTKLGFAGKWISIGGSYAGSLSAWYRLKYPQNVVGAIASSAPVKSKADFEEYDKHMASVISPECAQNIRKVVSEVDQSLLNPDSARKMRTLFQSTSIKNDLDFVYVVSDMAAWFIQYGQSERLCGSLVDPDYLVLHYARAGLRLFETVGINPEMASMQSAEGLKPGSNSAFGLRQWMYQSCTEFGFFQVAYHDKNVSVRSPSVDLKYHNAVCNRLFGINQQVNTEATNEKYYLPLLDSSVSQIFFTNGSVDPWSALSISEVNGNAVNINTPAVIMSGAAHCSDLATADLESVSAVQVQMTKLALEWLKL